VVQASSENTTTALLSWTAPNSNGEPITDYLVYYSTDNFETVDEEFTDGVSIATIAVLTGLESGTTYQFRVVATNAEGDSEPSNIVSFTAGSATQPNTATVEFDSVAYSVTEGGTAQVQISISDEIFQPLAAVLSYSGSASRGIDYPIPPAIIRWIPGGPLTQNISIPINEDVLVEPDENIVIQITSVVNGFLGARVSTIISILDNDSPVVAFEEATSTVAEGEEVDIVLTLTPPVSYQVNVLLSVGGSASPNDYEFNQVVQFLPGQAEFTIPFMALEDLIAESDETVFLSILTPPDGTYQTNESTRLHSITITDTEAEANTFEITTADFSAPEGTNVSVRIVATPPPSTQIVCTLQVGKNSTATSGTDFIVNGGVKQIAYPAAAAFIDVPIELLQDSEDSFGEESLDSAEATEFFDLELVALTGAGSLVIGDNDSCRITITDSTTPNRFGFVNASTAAQEPANAGDFETFLVRVQRTSPTPPLATDTRIEFSVGGTATITTDFTLPNSTVVGSNRYVTIPAGQDFVDIQVRVLGDEVAEGTETIILNIVAAYSVTDVDYEIGAITSHTISVNDLLPARQALPSTPDIFVTTSSVSIPALGINESFTPGVYTLAGAPLTRAVRLAREVWLLKNANQTHLLDQIYVEGNVVLIEVSGNHRVAWGYNGGLRIHGGNPNELNGVPSWNYLGMRDVIDPRDGTVYPTPTSEVIRDICIRGTSGAAIGDVVFGHRATVRDQQNNTRETFGRVDNLRFENLTFEKQGFGREVISGNSCPYRFSGDPAADPNRTDLDPTGRGYGKLKIYDARMRYDTAPAGSYSGLGAQFGIRCVGRMNYDFRNIENEPVTQHGIYLDSPQAYDAPCIFYNITQVENEAEYIGNGRGFFHIVNRNGPIAQGGNPGVPGGGELLFLNCIGHSNVSTSNPVPDGGGDFTLVGFHGRIRLIDCQSVGNAFNASPASQRALLTCWTDPTNPDIYRIPDPGGSGRECVTKEIVLQNFIATTDGQRRQMLNFIGIADVRLISFDLSDCTDCQPNAQIRVNNFRPTGGDWDLGVIRFHSPSPGTFASYAGWHPTATKLVHGLNSNPPNFVTLTNAQINNYNGQDPS
jgi:hypothetical protein